MVAEEIIGIFIFYKVYVFEAVFSVLTGSEQRAVNRVLFKMDTVFAHGNTNIADIVNGRIQFNIDWFFSTIDIIKQIVLNDDCPVMDASSEPSHIPVTRCRLEHRIMLIFIEWANCPWVLFIKVFGRSGVFRKVAPPSFLAI